MGGEPKTIPITFFSDQPKVQTDDHYPIRTRVRDFQYTGRLRWSKDGKLQQHIQYLGSSEDAWEDVPTEGAA